MTEPGRDIIVGILGQWASGKSTAARTLIDHLSGEGDVLFLTDFSYQRLSHLSNGRLGQRPDVLEQALWYAIPYSSPTTGLTTENGTKENR